MPRPAAQREADRQLDEAAHESRRYVDLQLDVLDHESGELLFRFGGRWDKAAREYVGDAEKSLQVRAFDLQRDYLRTLDTWIGDQIAGDRTRTDWVGEVVMAGGQRSGKTAMLIVGAIATALAIPGAIVWIVAPSEGFYAEPTGYLGATMPEAWYTSRGWPHWEWNLPNGSQILLQSAHTTGRLKKGKATAVFANEAQRISESSYNILLGRVFDDGGIVVSAANPPDVGDAGVWLTRYVKECKRGDRANARFYLFDPEKNPHIDQRPLLAAKAKMDPRTYAIQIRGEFRGLPDQVLYSWDPVEQERRRPDIGDCTREFLHYKEGDERSYDYVAAVDVQTLPWIAISLHKFFRNPAAPGDLDRALGWVVGEVFVDSGDELIAGKMLADELRRRKSSPDRCLLIIDASCFWQQQQRTEDLQRPEWRGKGSADMFKSFGFRVVRPDRNMKANPDVIDRCRAAAGRICNEAGERLVFADPDLAPRTCETIEKWKYTKHGRPSRDATVAHAGDCLTYWLWRFFPRRRRAKVDEGGAGSAPRLATSDRTKGFT